MVASSGMKSSPSSPSTRSISLTSTPTITVRRTGNAVPTQRLWSHTTSNLTLIWLAISLPLVLWDTGYVMLRPYSMPGGALHAPLWTPYALYGEIDYIYGWPAYNAHNGFTAAQGTLNVIETVGYAAYLWILWRYGKQDGSKGRGAPHSDIAGVLGKTREVSGRWAAWAVLIGFGVSLMTVSKTVLYWLNEMFSGFENIGHNDAFRLVFMWIIPNGAWIVLPSYMIYVFGAEILQGLESAAGDHRKRA